MWIICKEIDRVFGSCGFPGPAFRCLHVDCLFVNCLISRFEVRRVQVDWDSLFAPHVQLYSNSFVIAFLSTCQVAPESLRSCQIPHSLQSAPAWWRPASVALESRRTCTCCRP